MTETKRRDWIALSQAHRIGPSLFWHLVDRFGSPTAVLEASQRELQLVRGLGAARLAGLARKEQLRSSADDELIRLERFGGQAILYGEACYPELLRQTAQPPPVLYACGRSELLAEVSVGVVGSRAATSYGRRVSHKLGKDFARAGVCVVSGLAVGIDAEAHSGCMEGGGATIGVLGCGLDVVYPWKNHGLYKRIRSEGLLVSEYPLGTNPEGFRFPARNRIIAGLSLGIVVVEASKKSGSLITVQYALEEGREVFAVPGQIDSARSAGAHWLVQQGASLIVSADDVLEHLSAPSSAARTSFSGRAMLPKLDLDSALLLPIIEPYPQNRSELQHRSGLTLQQLQTALLTLELNGLAELMPGDEVRRTIELK